MKKTLSLLSLATLITAFSGMAHAENLFVNNQMRSMNGVQVTVTEKDEVKDSVCLMPNSMAYLNNYEPGHVYEIKAEVKDGYGCDGRAINTFSQELNMYSKDMQADINDNQITISVKY
ncbi:hypothetical protein SHI21_13745 [Bacteriovorax sp. PP10]|uniref:Uncharacterized protein n=1 Tax=Bacteriovorax antarcticus TaxID=3088717 RepID=A0ABU5VW34_9BACT|nr:hypothetical protein [Bacteriovorax sp. PP10]MEA9357283.1 hypothetical protein [Bacteriovorax sp. PP10]